MTRLRLCGRPLMVAAALLGGLLIAGCGGGSALYSKSWLNATDLTSVVTATGAPGHRAFHVHLTGKAGNLYWKSDWNGAVDVAAGTGSEIQVTPRGKPLSPGTSPVPGQVPLQSMVFSRSTIYWLPLGIMKKTLAAAGKIAAADAGKTWISLSASDTSSAGSTRGKILVLAATLADPYLFLDMLASGNASAIYLHSGSLGGQTYRVFKVSVDSSSAASAVPSVEGGLVHLLASATGSTTLALEIWVSPDGSLGQIQFSSTAKAKSPLPTMSSTISMAGPEVPPSTAIASIPLQHSALPLSILAGAGSQASSNSTSAESGQTSGQTPESCAEDQADHGTDAHCAPATTAG